MNRLNFGKVLVGLFFIAGFAGPVLSGPVLSGENQVIKSAELDTLAGERTVAFFALDLKTGKSYELGGARLDERRTPWSSFKIPNLVIALETGVSEGGNALRKWDRKKHPAQSYWPSVWKKDHTLESAFQSSVVWYFKEIASDVGTTRYRKYLEHFSYGNKSVAEGSRDFWLNGDLKISPREQVQFVSALHSGDFRVSSETLATLEQASLIAAQDGYSLHAKSGAGRIRARASKGGFEGWYVGWVDGPEGHDTAFALFTEGQSHQAIKKFRRKFSEQALIEIDALPANWTVK